MPHVNDATDSPDIFLTNMTRKKTKESVIELETFLDYSLFVQPHDATPLPQSINYQRLLSLVIS